MISTKNIREKKGLSKGILDTTAVAEVAQILSFVNFAWRYKWAMRLELTGIKKYWRCARQVELKLDWLLAIFVRNLYRIDNNKKLTESIKTKQVIDSE